MTQETSAPNKKQKITFDLHGNLEPFIFPNVPSSALLSYGFPLPHIDKAIISS